MGYKHTMIAEVEEGGTVSVRIPELAAGQKVEVTITAATPPREGKRILGQLKGKIHIMPNFDDPPPGFEDYY
jgi:hypothetical protein